MKMKTMILNVLISLVFITASYSQERQVKENQLWGDFQSDRFERSIKTRPGVYLNIDHKYGRIEIQSWEKDEILVKGEKRAASEEKEDGKKFLKNINIDISESINHVGITTDYPTVRPSRIKSFQVTYSLKVPRNCNIRIENTFGDVEIYDITGELNVSTSHSIIKTHNIDGEVTLNNKFGTIDVNNVTGYTETETTNGDITVTKIGGDFTGVNKFGKIVMISNCI